MATSERNRFVGRLSRLLRVSKIPAQDPSLLPALAPVPELPEIAGHLGLDRHVQRIFNSAQSGYEKPHPEAFHGVLDALGGGDEVWMIGDNADVAGAKAVGIPAILVRRRREGVEPYCENLGGIAAIVEG